MADSTAICYYECVVKIVLIYPPPWKIARPGTDLDDPAEGAPPGISTTLCLSGDIRHLPCGLLSLAAQARAAGHAVTVLNLFFFAWQDIEQIVKAHPARLFGLSCFTSNRRGTLYTADLIRSIYPDAHIALGGPHASALPREMLEHGESIDTIVIGEGEDTVTELADRIESGASPGGIAGTAFRADSGIELAPPRDRIDDLDRLQNPFLLYNDYILLVSRGCPWDCAFCSSTCIWGRRQHRHSVRYALDMIEHIVFRHGHRAFAVKDETFTLDRDYVLSLCRGMRERGISSAWSCDTRADLLDEELLREMRRAGCRRISLGVESASPRILKNLNKNIDPAAVRKAAGLARRCGLQVRFYMIAGSPGETMETLNESLALIREARPSEVIFNPFTLLPGTQAFEDAERDGHVSRGMFFTDDFFELTPLSGPGSMPIDAEVASWMVQHQGLHEMSPLSAEECEHVVESFPDLGSARLDRAHALLRAGDTERAAQNARQALDMNCPQPGLARNCLACCAAARGDMQGALEHLIAARESDYSAVVEENIERAQRWAAAGGPACGLPLELRASNVFEITVPLRQPAGPGAVTVTSADRPLRYKPLMPE